MRGIIFFCLTVVILSGCKARTASDRQSDLKDDNGAAPEVLAADGQVSPMIDKDQRVSLRSLVNFLYCTDKGKKVHSVEEFLGLLPAYIFEKSALVFNQSSLCGDEINKKFPRTLLLEEVNGLVIAYTSQPGKSCFNSLEVLQVTNMLKNAAGENEAYRVPRNVPNSFLAMEFDARKTPEVHGPNAEICASCHARAGKLLPIWKVNVTADGGRSKSENWPNVFFGGSFVNVELPSAEFFNEAVNNVRFNRMPEVNGTAPQGGSLNALRAFDQLFVHNGGAINPEPNFVEYGNPKGKRKSLNLGMPITVDCNAVNGSPASDPSSQSVSGACRATTVSGVYCGCSVVASEKDCIKQNVKHAKQCFGSSVDYTFKAGEKCSR